MRYTIVQSLCSNLIQLVIITFWPVSSTDSDIGCWSDWLETGWLKPSTCAMSSMFLRVVDFRFIVAELQLYCYIYHYCVYWVLIVQHNPFYCHMPCKTRTLNDSEQFKNNIKTILFANTNNINNTFTLYNWIYLTYTVDSFNF